MAPTNSDSWHILLYSPEHSVCIDWVKELLNRDEFMHCKFSMVSSLPEARNILSNRFCGVFLVCITANNYSIIEQALAARYELSPSTKIVALLDGDGLSLITSKLITMDVDEVVHCNNQQWLQAVLLKHYFVRKRSNGLLPYPDFNRHSSLVDRIHHDFPFGIVRVVLKPEVYVEYINREAERILGYTVEQHRENNELRNRFIPDERIQLILENAPNGNDYIKRRFKLGHSHGIARWVEAVYIPGFIHNKTYQTIEVILRDVTREEIDKALQKAVYDIARMTSTNFSLNRIFVVTHKIISDLINIDNFYIALYNSENNEVTFPYFVDSTDIKTPNPRRNGHGLTEYVIRTGKTLLCQPSCFDELIFKNEIDLIGTKPMAWLGVPLIFHGNILGVMAIQHYTNTNAFGEIEQYILEYFSEQVARTIDYKRKADTVKLLSIAVEQSPVSVVITTLKPEIVYINSTFTKVTGYEPHEVLGQNPRFLQSGHTPKERYTKLWDTITAGKTWSGELINKRKNGEIFYEESIIVPITDELGKNAYYLSVKIDITEKKKLIYAP